MMLQFGMIYQANYLTCPATENKRLVSDSLDKTLKRLKKKLTMQENLGSMELRNLVSKYVYSNGLEEELLIAKDYFTMDQVRSQLRCLLHYHYEEIEALLMMVIDSKLVEASA